MQIAALPEDEEQRLQTLLDYEVLDSEDELVFDELTELASAICGTEISLISLVDRDRQWFKSRVGLDARETHRDLAFCAHAILDKQVFEVPNASEDERFHDNPLVTSDPSIRFYAGAPLTTKSGHRIGTLCVIDKQPKALNNDQRRALEILSHQVVSQLDLRLQHKRMQRMQAEREKFFAILAHDIRSPFNGILGLSRVLKESAGTLKGEQVENLANELLNSSLDVYQLIDEILQWSQSRLGSTEPELQTLVVKEVFESGVKILREAMSQKGIALLNHIDAKHVVWGDVTLLKAVVRNLLANAIKYSKNQGQIRVSSRLDDGQVILRIEDDGLGISDQLRKKLFTRGVKSQVGTSGELGHGLGLNLAYDFMLLQQGDLWLDKQYTSGAAFELSLPFSSN